MQTSIEGLPVVNLFPDSRAAAAGIKVGDRLLRVNGHVINDPFDYVRALNASPRVVEVDFLRDGQLLHTRWELPFEDAILS